jgi:hypothetical protein
MTRRFGCQVAVVDVNDVGSEVLSASPELDIRSVQDLMRDNPMGQGAQGTPVAVLRPLLNAPTISEWPRRSIDSSGGWVVPLAGMGDADLRLSTRGSWSADNDTLPIDL